MGNDTHKSPTSRNIYLSADTNGIRARITGAVGAAASTTEDEFLLVDSVFHAHLGGFVDVSDLKQSDSLLLSKISKNYDPQTSEREG